MIVAMQDAASEDQIQHVIDQLVHMGFEVHRSTGAGKTVLGGVGSANRFRYARSRDDAGRAGSPPHHRALQTRRTQFSSRRHGREVRQRTRNRRQRSYGHGRTLLGRIPRATVHRLRVDRESWRKSACAEAHSSRAPLRIPSRVWAPKASSCLREAGDRFKLLVISEVMEISQIELMMPYVDIFQVGARNMQNFNLLRELGKIRKPSAAEARHCRDARRVAALRGIPAVGWKLRNHSLRARHPHLRDLHAQHDGHFRDPDRAQAVAPAHHGRPVARHRDAATRSLRWPWLRWPQEPMRC